MTLRRLRHLLLALVLGSCAGLGAELLLLEHSEGVAQTTPLLALAIAAVACLAYWRYPVPSARLTFRACMIGLCAVSLAGLYFHFTGNREFELELHPAASGLELAWQSLRGATPALAPGSILGLGLLGLAASAAPVEGAAAEDRRPSPPSISRRPSR